MDKKMDVKRVIIAIFVIFKPIFCVNNKFPDGFLFGVSTAAYQIEGGSDSRGETIFDHHTRLNPSIIADSSNASIACDSYIHYQEDIALLENLGVDFYRFSIAWSRILPTGYSNRVNPDGIRYYTALIDGLLAKNIQPMVTMFHADLPKPLLDIGGWVNPVLADLFEDYADILFKNFGSKVKFWITFNANFWGYGDAEFPPMLNLTGIGEYLTAKNTLVAHANVYHLYNREYRESQKGEIGFVIDGRWLESGSDLPEDRDATERAREFLLGLMSAPIFGQGDFPKVVKERVEALSLREGFFRSRLPVLSQEEQKHIKGSSDFIGLNIYTTHLVKDAREDSQIGPSFTKDIGVKLYHDAKWPGAKSPWLKVVPEGLRNVLGWFKAKYGNPPIFVTENGYSDDGELDDVKRIEFFKLHLKALLEAIHEDGVQVRGYAAWSLLDNFEWLLGYTEKFGLHHVDFSDPARPRTPKSSAKWYKKLIERRQLTETTPPDDIKQEL